MTSSYNRYFAEARVQTEGKKYDGLKIKGQFKS